MTELIIIRHGKTSWNLEKRIQGSTDIELHPLGRRARRASDTGRTPCNLFQHSQTRLSDGGAHRVIHHEGLRERNFGVFEGLTADDIQMRYPEAWEHFKNWNPDYAMPRGVSLREYQKASIESLY